MCEVVFANGGRKKKESLIRLQPLVSSTLPTP